MLAFGLVGFTVFGVAATTHWLLPGFDWRLGFVLGAVVAATDAIAATATAKRLGLPRSITELLEAESLVNDGSGLVALRFTLALVLTGDDPFVRGRRSDTVLLDSHGSCLIGLLVGIAVYWVQYRISDPQVEITISLVTPYIAYLAAESAQCSGVLATLACGIYIGRRSSAFYSLPARMEASAVWGTIDFVLNGFGVPRVGTATSSHPLGNSKLWYSAADFRGRSIQRGCHSTPLALGLPRRIHFISPVQRLLSRHEPAAVSPRSVFLVGWGGMRGVLALAAALSLPERLNNGAPFPQRNMIIFLSFCAIFTTLVLQGLSMPALIRQLGLAGVSTNEEELIARRQMIQSALDSLAKLSEQAAGQDHSAYERLEDYYRRRLLLLDAGEGGHESATQEAQHYLALAQEMRDIERTVANKLHNENKIHDEVLRKLEHELDLLDTRFYRP